MNLTEIVIVAVLAVAVFFALRHIFKMRKSGCSCGCANCDKACTKANRK